MFEVILNVLMIFLLFTAFYVVFSGELLKSVLALTIFSTIMVTIFIMLQAPDVALAEAVIAAGLTIGFFVIAINKTGDSLK